MEAKENYDGSKCLYSGFYILKIYFIDIYLICLAHSILGLPHCLTFSYHEALLQKVIQPLQMHVFLHYL